MSVCLRVFVFGWFWKFVYGNMGVSKNNGIPKMDGL